jgi:hypothetical protein
MLIASYTIGSGVVTDTVLFTYHDVLFGFKWEGSHPLVLTKVTGVCFGGSPDIDVALLHHANFRSGSGTGILSADLTVTSTTTGSEATSFSSATINSGQWVWCWVKQTTAEPYQCVINLYGHLTE